MSIDVKKSVIINKSPEELYRFWRNFENLPRFMNHIKSVKTLDDKHSHWVAKAPLGTSMEWDAEILTENEPKTIVWHSLEGADVESVGSVAFTSADDGSGTEVKVTMEYNPPGGALGAAVAAIFGENPEQQLEEDLNRFKQLPDFSQTCCTNDKSSKMQMKNPCLAFQDSELSAKLIGI